MGLRQPETKNDLMVARLIEARAARMVELLEARHTAGAYPAELVDNERRLLAMAAHEWCVRYPGLTQPPGDEPAPAQMCSFEEAE
jgi:hypothetical protein